jgi:hypothetical protein
MKPKFDWDRMIELLLTIYGFFAFTCIALIARGVALNTIHLETSAGLPECLDALKASLACWGVWAFSRAGRALRNRREDPPPPETPGIE